VTRSRPVPSLPLDFLEFYIPDFLIQSARPPEMPTPLSPPFPPSHFTWSHTFIFAFLTTPFMFPPPPEVPAPKSRRWLSLFSFRVFALLFAPSIARCYHGLMCDNSVHLDPSLFPPLPLKMLSRKRAHLYLFISSLFLLVFLPAHLPKRLQSRCRITNPSFCLSYPPQNSRPAPFVLFPPTLEVA